MSDPTPQQPAETSAIKEEPKSVSSEVSGTSAITRPAETPASSPSVQTKQAKPKEGKPMSKKPQRKFSNETVLSRARRMMRSQLNPVAQALGLEKYDPDSFNKKLDELKKAKESQMSEGERSGLKMKELEDRIIDLTTKLNAATTESVKAKRELTNFQKDAARQQTEWEIKELASRAGIQDVEYGMHLLKGYIKGLPEGEKIESPEQIKGFFEGLKKDPTKRLLFAEEKVAAGPKSVAETQVATQGQTQQAQSSIPPQGTPKPGEVTQGGKEDVNVMDKEKWSKQDFNKYSREKYGFAGSLA